MKLLKDTFLTFGTQSISIALLIISNMLIARMLGPSGKGVYTLVTLVPSILVLIGNLGIWLANLYLGGKNRYSLSDLVSNSLALSVVMGGFVFAGFLAYYFVADPPSFSGVDRTFLFMAAGTAPLSLLIMYFSYILLGQKLLGKFNLLNAVQNGLLLMLVTLFLFVFGAGTQGTLAAWFLSILCTGAFAIVLVHRLAPIRFSVSLPLLKDSIFFGLKGYLGSIVSFLNYRLNILLVAFYLNVAEVGCFSIAVAVAESLWLLPQAVGTIILMRTPGSKSEELNESTAKICRNTLFFVFFVAVLFFALGKYLILLLFGQAYLRSLAPFQILLPGAVGISICKVLGNEIAMRGKPAVNTYISLAALAINIPLNVLLIPNWGLEGAALASTAAYGLSSILSILFFLRVSGNSLRNTILIGRKDLDLYGALWKQALRVAKIRELGAYGRAVLKSLM